MFRKNQETLLITVLISNHPCDLKKERLQINGVSCNSKNNFVIKAVVLFGLATIAFYLLTEHRTHLLAYSSYILLLGFVLCMFSCAEGIESMEDMKITEITEGAVEEDTIMESTIIRKRSRKEVDRRVEGMRIYTSMSTTRRDSHEQHGSI